MTNTKHDPAELDGVTDATIQVEYGGVSYTFPASIEDADGDVLDALEEGKASTALRALLSPEDWDRFKSTRPKVRDYGQLWDAYAARIGLDSLGK